MLKNDSQKNVQNRLNFNILPGAHSKLSLKERSVYEKSLNEFKRLCHFKCLI